ncbi:MAG: hypothetical protein ACHQJ6_05040 [Candidatus Berkiellales bacterium]
MVNGSSSDELDWSKAETTVQKGAILATLAAILVLAWYHPNFLAIALTTAAGGTKLVAPEKFKNAVAIMDSHSILWISAIAGMAFGSFSGLAFPGLALGLYLGHFLEENQKVRAVASVLSTVTPLIGGAVNIAGTLIGGTFAVGKTIAATVGATAGLVNKAGSIFAEESSSSEDDVPSPEAEDVSFPEAAPETTANPPIVKQYERKRSEAQHEAAPQAEGSFWDMFEWRRAPRQRPQ